VLFNEDFKKILQEVVTVFNKGENDPSTNESTLNESVSGSSISAPFGASTQKVNEKQERDLMFKIRKSLNHEFEPIMAEFAKLD
jgi:hypothetical protein